jgi:hypothetical protein
MIFANTEWLSHTLTAVVTAAGTLVPVWLYYRRQSAVISAQAAKDTYEMDKVRSSDAYQQLLEARKDDIADRANIRLIIAAQDKRITELALLEEECRKRGVDQGLRIYELESIKTFLEGRVKALEAASQETMTQHASSVAVGLVNLAAATAANLSDKARGEAQRVVGEATAVSTALKACAENTPGCPLGTKDEMVAANERITRHAQANAEQLKVLHEELDSMKGTNP